METEEYGQRLYGFDQPLERERIALIGEVFDAFTHRRIADLGPLSGRRCLDVGAGPGTVAAWLAEQAGPRGEVIALDRDTSLLREADHPGLRIWEADVDTAADAELPPPGFDLIHARLTLCHLPRREEVLRRLVSWLAPGGHLLVSDVINTMASGSAHPAVRTMTSAFDHALVTTLDSDLNYARAYPTPLTEAGLVDVDLAADIPLVRAGSRTARFWELTFDAMRTEILATGLIDAAGFSEAMNHLGTPGTHELGYTLVSAWGRSASPAK
ncbi:class I SAM-dependent methyltransferase [Streptomyces sp. NBC_00237]|uniref:class I SAM-dependent methyltransferase n=1 Tax=Streptomyces sp. NBC_00237 TaxID=2975687 RepID=UPI0022579C5A|nr:class I SAM-dependent methyltransferase [Streptomyces sp. NBC_00237]MCX5203193.1 class I SAM-dependent methyltransferase [Streptomyces sp. NBC_00237]